ncbi:MAG: isoprenylcysteine carboxylmethyltransferase family protein [Deltaproteobacteria bacterium]|nr:isoprenylcysteine carboxylmethyltransferase family protein [Deltaproteobacteria bacterium]
MNPHLGMLLHVLAFSFWSSFWPRRFVKARLEPVTGWVAYRFFYVVGTVFLLGASVVYLAQRSPDGIVLWDLHSRAWFRPMIEVLFGLCVFFLYAAVPMGPSFFGLAKPPPKFFVLQSGIYRITRHPLYVAVFLMLVAKLLVFGTTVALIWSAGLFAYNVLGAMFLETPSARKHFGPEFDEYRARVHWFPFLSILRGKEKLVPSEFSGRGLAVLAGMYLALLVGHPLLVRLTYGLPRLGNVSQWVADHRSGRTSPEQSEMSAAEAPSRPVVEAPRSAVARSATLDVQTVARE